MARTTEPNAIDRLAELDDRVFDAIAGWDSPRFDRFLPGLSQDRKSVV